MTDYQSIKEVVLAKLEAHIHELRDRFGIDTIGIFGSVSRGEDNPESDVDVLYTFRPGESTLANLVSLGAYLEELFGRKVDLIAERSLSPYIRSEVIAEVVMV